MNRTGPRRVAISLAAIVGLAACGGGDDDDTEGSGASAPPSASSAPVADVDDDTEPAEGGDDVETDSASDQTGGGGSWCDQVRAAAASDAPSPINFDFFGLDAQAIEAQVNANVEVLENWASIAPSEIKTSVETIVGAFETFAELGNDAGWDLTAMVNDPQFAATFEAPELEAATDAVDAYNRDSCGVDLGPDGGAPPADDPAAGGDDLVSQILAGFGLPPSFLTDQQRQCMNIELEDDFPDGLGDDFVLDETLGAALDAAAQACGVTIG